MAAKGLEEFRKKGTTTKAVSFFDDDALKTAKMFCEKKLACEIEHIRRVNLKRFSKRIGDEIERRKNLSEKEKLQDELKRIGRQAQYELVRKRNQLYKEKLKCR